MGRGGQTTSARFKPEPAELTKLRPCLRRPTTGHGTTHPVTRTISRKAQTHDKERPRLAGP